MYLIKDPAKNIVGRITFEKLLNKKKMEVSQNALPP